VHHVPHPFGNFSIAAASSKNPALRLVKMFEVQYSFEAEDAANSVSRLSAFVEPFQRLLPVN